jgi:hypothetical protein
MYKILFLGFLIGSAQVKAALVNAVSLQGMVVDKYAEQGFVSIQDSFDQVQLYPRTWVQKVLGAKANAKKPILINATISIAELNEMHDSCVKTFSKNQYAKKMCPVKLTAIDYSALQK